METVPLSLPQTMLAGSINGRYQLMAELFTMILQQPDQSPTYSGMDDIFIIADRNSFRKLRIQVQMVLLISGGCIYKHPMLLHLIFTPNTNHRSFSGPVCAHVRVL